MKRLRADLMNPTPSSVPFLPISSGDDVETPDDKPMEMNEILDRLYQYVAKNEIVII